MDSGVGAVRNGWLKLLPDLLYHGKGMASNIKSKTAQKNKLLMH